MEVNEDFMRKDFDVGQYARKLLEENASIPEQLASLTCNTSALDRQLKEQISVHYDQLLSQAGNIESLEDVLSVLNHHVTGLRLSCGRACGKVGDLYKKTEVRTLQLSRLHETCSLLRNAIRVLQLTSRLKGDSTATGSTDVNGVSSTLSNDLAKNALLVQELRDLSTENPDLKDLHLVQNELAQVANYTQEVLSAARQALKQGAKQQHQARVATALQTFHNLKCLMPQLEGYGRELVNECGQTLKAFDQFSSKLDQTRPSEASSVVPGSASLPRQSQSSVTIRTNVWNDVSRFVEFLLSVCSQLNVVHTVAARKRDSTTHQLFDQLLDSDQFYAQLFQKLTDLAKSSFDNASSLAKQNLESEYPRLLRYMAPVFAKLQQLKSILPNGEQQLRAVLVGVETNYLSKSLARLFDSVNLAFQFSNNVNIDSSAGNAEAASAQVLQKLNDASSSSRTLLLATAEVDSILRTIRDELDVCKFDKTLFEQARKNVAKTLQLFGVKCEQLLSTDGEASQIISSITNGQKRNVEIVNTLSYLCGEITCLFDQDQFLAGDGYLVEAKETLNNLMRSAVRPLMSSIQDALFAIIVTMHQENFNLSEDENKNVAQCSLYVRELQQVINRVWKEYLEPHECKDLIFDEATAVVREALEMFLVHASLVRPISDSGKMRLIADFAQVELALSTLCRNVSRDLQPLYTHFKAVRILLSTTEPLDALFAAADDGQSVDENFTSRNLLVPGRTVPYSLLIHFLISLSPADLPSPYSTANWSVTRYAEWFVKHTKELERLQFLKGTLEAYARSVQTEGKTSYAPLYPTLMDLLKRGFEHEQEK